MFKFSIIISLLSLSFSEPFNGLTLITSTNNNNGNSTMDFSHLIDNDGNILNEWRHDTPPTSIAYLAPDSILYVPCKKNNSTNNTLRQPIGGRFKKMDWDGNILWDFSLPEEICTPHHDIAILPNGNILAICSEVRTPQEVASKGKIVINPNVPLTLDMIIEIMPIGEDNAEIVWEWRFWDRLIQNIDPDLDNFNSISNNPQQLDINCLADLTGFTMYDWNHCNSISYNKDLKQIILSSRHMNEIYIIEHTDSNTDAAGSIGGVYNKGGDFLYRWGNPRNYGMNASQKLFNPHGVNWIESNSPGEGNILVFNNDFFADSLSAVVEITPPINDFGDYLFDNIYGPETFYWSYQSNFYSAVQSGAYRLPNGNTLITSSRDRNIFEITTSNSIAWVYNGPLETARALKYPINYFTDDMLIGDFNNDSLLNVLDVVILVNNILYNNSEQTYDLNNDQISNVIDIVILVNLIL